MSNLPAQTSPTYASDEDIAVRAGGDWVHLCPPWQLQAAGTDGVFSSGAPWVMTSASVNFEANGVAPNQVVHLTAPRANFTGSGQMLAIDSVAGNSVTLRRLHKDLNVGQPPAPAAGLTGVVFAINTLDPQIEEVSFRLKRRFAIDENIPYRDSDWLYDKRDLREATVLSVLLDRYTYEARTERGDFPRKIDLVGRQLAEIMAQLNIRWGPVGNSTESISLFSTRLSR